MGSQLCQAREMDPLGKLVMESKAEGEVDPRCAKLVARSSSALALARRSIETGQEKEKDHHDPASPRRHAHTSHLGGKGI